MSSFYVIQVNTKISINPVKNDGIIIFRSWGINASKNIKGKAWINLYDSKGNVLLHMVFRPSEGHLAVYAFQVDSGASEQRTVDLASHFQGVNTTIAVYDHGDHYQILTNGRTALNFKKIHHDAEVVSIEYRKSGDDILSHSIAVQTYKDWAALVPGSC